MDDEELVRGRMVVVLCVHRVHPGGLDDPDGREVGREGRGGGKGREGGVIYEQRATGGSGIWEGREGWDAVCGYAEGC